MATAKNDFLIMFFSVNQQQFCLPFQWNQTTKIPTKAVITKQFLLQHLFSKIIIICSY